MLLLTYLGFYYAINVIETSDNIYQSEFNFQGLIFVINLIMIKKSELSRCLKEANEFYNEGQYDKCLKYYLDLER